MSLSTRRKPVLAALSAGRTPFAGRRNLQEAADRDVEVALRSEPVVRKAADFRFETVLARTSCPFSVVTSLIM